MAIEQAERAKVEEIVRRFARKDKRQIALTPETSLFDDLSVNSASRVDIILELEDTFGISITDDEADAIATVGDLLEAVSVRIAAKASA